MAKKNINVLMDICLNNRIMLRMLGISYVLKLEGQVKQLVSYQREVDKGKLTAVANFEKLKFRVCSIRPCSQED